MVSRSGMELKNHSGATFPKQQKHTVSHRWEAKIENTA